MDKLEATPELVSDVGKTLHVFHGRGYCTQGQHLAQSTYHCWDEARVVIGAINGHVPKEYPDQGEHPMTLAAREQGKRETEERTRRARKTNKGDILE